MTLRELLDKATPAPWFVVGQPWNDSAPYINAGSEDPHHGSIVCDFIDWREGAGEVPNSENDARLISLAPVMAALLNDMAEVLAELGDRVRIPGYGPMSSCCDGPDGTHEDDCPLAALLARYGSLGEEDT